MKIMFTNIGRRTYIVDYAVQLLNRGLISTVYVTDINEETAGFWVSDKVKSIFTPYVSGNEDFYVDFLVKTVKTEGIDIIIPLMDFELKMLAANKKIFACAGCTVVVSDGELIKNTLDKRLTLGLCRQSNLPYPATYYSYRDVPENCKIVRKRIFGSGSKGLSFHEDISELFDFVEGRDLIQIKIEGVEYGLDILNDLDGNFIHAAIKRKLLMRAGETDKASVIFDDRLFEFAKKTGLVTKHIGNIDMDIILDKNNQPYIIDINPRFGGGYPFTHAAGFNYLEAVIKMVQGVPFKIPRKASLITGMKGISLFYTSHNKTDG